MLDACAPTPEALHVKQFHLRTETIVPTDEPMLRMEIQRRLHGAISGEERRQRLGQYYTIRWNDPAVKNQGEVKVVFEYQQGSSASLVKKLTEKFPASDSAGVVEFAIIGDDYFTHGKVLTWKATLFRDQKVVASRQSYLWQ